MRKPVQNHAAPGFTLAELLIVALIIIVLVGIAVPNLTEQLEKARQSTDIANLRGAFATARIAEISGEVTRDGKRIRIGDQNTLRDGDDGYALVFWYDADRGLYPDGILDPADGGLQVRDGADRDSIVTADKSLVTSRMMAHGTHVTIDDALPEPIEYGNYHDEPGALPGQFASGYANMRICVQFRLSDSGVLSLAKIRFADIMNPDPDT